MDRLTEAELARMRAEHVPERMVARDYCRKCEYTRKYTVVRAPWPCDAARLLEHFAPGPVPHLAGIATVHSDVAARKEFGDGVGAGLCGPSCSEELAQ